VRLAAFRYWFLTNDEGSRGCEGASVELTAVL